MLVDKEFKPRPFSVAKRLPDENKLVCKAHPMIRIFGNKKGIQITFRTIQRNESWLQVQMDGTEAKKLGEALVRYGNTVLDCEKETENGSKTANR